MFSCVFLMCFLLFLATQKNTNKKQTQQKKDIEKHKKKTQQTTHNKINKKNTHKIISKIQNKTKKNTTTQRKMRIFVFVVFFFGV